MDSYKLQLFLHVAVALVALGATFAIPFLHAWGERRGVGATRMALEFSGHLERVLIVPGTIILALIGTGLIFDDRTGYKDDFPGWLTVSIAWFVLGFVVAAVFQRRNVDAALAALDGVDASAGFPGAYAPASARIKATGAFLALSTIGVAFLMVWKPGQ